MEWLIRESGLTLVQGTTAELYGYETFDSKDIIRRRDDYLVGEQWPTMVQTVVLRKDP